MMKKQSLRISLIMSPLMIACSVLVSQAPLAKADSENRPCSNGILRGDYGFAIEGQILAGPRAGPVRGVAMTHFDGQGNLSQVDHVVVNGVPQAAEWKPETGTYTVNPDCTGKAQFSGPDGGPAVNLFFVVVRNGQEIRTVVSEGIAASSVGIKID
jgi:hypothetical protein